MTKPIDIPLGDDQKWTIVNDGRITHVCDDGTRTTTALKEKSCKNCDEEFPEDARYFALSVRNTR